MSRFKQEIGSYYRADILRIGQHEAAHYVSARVLGFKTGAIDLTMTDLAGAHLAGAEITPACALRDLASVVDYLERRVVVLYAGAWGESLKNGELDPERAARSLSEGGAVQDHQKASELIQLIRNIRFPDAQPEDEVQSGLTMIFDELWDRAASVVKGDHEMVEGLGRRLASDTKYVGERTTFSEEELEGLPSIQMRFGTAAGTNS